MGDVLWWSVVLIGLVLAAFVAAAHVKKRFTGPEDTDGANFTLADLRALHKSGKMTTEEFEKAKTVILSSVVRTDEPAVTDKPQPPPPDSTPPVP
jgi:hypothetical protein